MPKKYWICQMSAENWPICLEDLSYGVPLRSGIYGVEQVVLVREGDGLFFYLQKQGVVAYAESTSTMYEDPEYRGAVGKEYPLRIHFEVIKSTDTAIPFGDIKGHVSNKQSGALITNGASLFGKSMIPISSNDADYLLGLL